MHPRIRRHREGQERDPKEDDEEGTTKKTDVDFDELRRRRREREQSKQGSGMWKEGG